MMMPFLFNILNLKTNRLLLSNLNLLGDGQLPYPLPLLLPILLYSFQGTLTSIQFRCDRVYAVCLLQLFLGSIGIINAGPGIEENAMSF